MDGKVREFADLEVWKQAHRLALLTYRFTESFPRYEIYGLVSQLRRAAVSVASNIAEGFSRRSRDDKVRFYMMSVGSLAELQCQLIIARDLHFLERTAYLQLQPITVSVRKMLYGIIGSAESANY